MHQTLERIAPAKLNLTLRVTGRRADGYHLLDGLTAFCALGDRVRIRPVDGEDRLTLHGPFAESIDGVNIAARARDRFRDAAGWRQALDIEIEKRIPVAAGLGGGSADAAATLLSLTEMWPGPPISSKALGEIALSLGADVPVCLAGAPARMRGIGEVIQPLGALPALDVVLVNPGTGVSSGDVFKSFEGPYSPPLDRPETTWSADRLFALLGRRGHNDLLRPALVQVPEIDDILGLLDAQPQVRCAGMSGSGATCFALMDPSATSRTGQVVDQLRARGWWSVATRLDSGPSDRSGGSRVTIGPGPTSA